MNVGLLRDRVDKGLVALRGNGVPEVLTAAKDGRGVLGLSNPLEVGHEDATAAGGAKLLLLHARLQEEERQVGLLVGGGVGGDNGRDRGLSALGLGTEDRVAVLGSKVKGRGGNRGDAVLRVSARADLGDAVSTGGRVLGADGLTERGEDVEGVVKGSNVLVGVKLRRAGVVELAEQSTDGSLVALAVSAADVAERGLDVRGGSLLARDGRERVGRRDELVDTSLDGRVVVELLEEGLAARRDALGDEGRLFCQFYSSLRCLFGMHEARRLHGACYARRITPPGTEWAARHARGHGEQRQATGTEANES